MRKFCAMLVGVAALALALQVRGEALLVDGVQAVVHDSIVTYMEVLNMSLPAEQVLARTYRGQFDMYQKKAVEARNDSLEQLIERQLILHDFMVTFNQPERAALIDREIKKDVDREIDAEIRTRYGGNRISFVRTLQAEGITLERHRQQIRDRNIVTWLRQKNIYSEIILSPHRVEAFYLAHRDEFKVQEELKLRIIVLKCPSEAQAPRTEKLAEDILAELQKGATFAEMATIHSEGSERSEGGDLHWWEPSRMVKSLADTALSLQPGQHSGVLSRSAGDDYWVCQYEKGAPTVARHYMADKVSMKENMVEERKLSSGSVLTNLPPPSEFYLLLVEDKRPARFKPLTEVREQIEKDLQTQERARLEKTWVDKLKKKTFVRVF
jgi:peptidyl-prolyl cis-trans isomerase SurA